MFPFSYHRPSDVAQAVALLEMHEEAKILAGGQTLVPTLKQRLASPSDLVDLSGMEGLAGVSRGEGRLMVGAMTRHADVAGSPLLRTSLPALADLAGLIGDPAVRSRGTIGGSIANNDPAADYPAACLALGATILTDRRRLPAGEFFVGLFETALEPTEIVLGVDFPPCERAAYEKLRNPASRYAMAGVFAAQLEGEARVAVTGAGQNGVFRWAEAEAALSRHFAPEALDGLLPDVEEMISDIHGGGDYRAHLVAVMARRAVARAYKVP